MTAISDIPVRGVEDHFCTFCHTPLPNYGALFITPDKSQICCCRKCAVEVLPRLMADAIGANEIEKNRAQTFWNLAEGHYWKGISSRLMARIK